MGIQRRMVHIGAQAGAAVVGAVGTPLAQRTAVGTAGHGPPQPRATTTGIVTDGRDAHGVDALVAPQPVHVDDGPQVPGDIRDPDMHSAYEA